MKSKNQLMVAVMAGGLMGGCMGPPPEEDGGQEVVGVATTQQALSNQMGPSLEPMETAQAVHCNLVVYQPYLVWSSSSYQARAFAYVSCPSWVSDIELVVGLKDENEIIRMRRFSCSGTSTCVGGYNSYSPWGTWQTVASASVHRWNDHRQSPWTNLSRQ
jgi:hypothetical protein